MAQQRSICMHDFMGKNCRSRYINICFDGTTSGVRATCPRHGFGAADPMIIYFRTGREFHPKKFRICVVIPFEPFTCFIAWRFCAVFDVKIEMVRAEEFFNDGFGATAKGAEGYGRNSCGEVVRGARHGWNPSS